ncbi:hypothetical protein [Paratractidigestivibacter sp.]|uniref:hypothetical protein n=1 Tax=Paratractidigestivibacter sp. TaxID=2847316 RepID=UPI002ACB0CC1|nr:hypothetical protein [Paratractidigestivibacter sp.]
MAGKKGYCLGEIRNKGGSEIHGVCFGVNKKNKDEVMARIARGEKVGCHAMIVNRPEGFKTVFFELDEA